MACELRVHHFLALGEGHSTEDELLWCYGRCGERRALEVLARRLWPGLRRAALTLAVAAADIEDVVQETLLLVQRHARAWQRRAPARRWVERILRHVALSWRRARRLLVLREAEALDPLGETGAASRLEAPVVDVMDACLWPRARTALDALAEGEREVLLLRALGHAFGEIAARETHGPSEGSLRLRAMRALRKLRHAMAVEPAVRRSPAP